ncbi:MarR family transcriptional regulator [Alkalihalobacillus alcalophilus ATCC 27647 = CGMCC 1.3604]|uniref:MarR family transcriptional regulator n=1 Tax=Alkalihalobacillus alcalophilus ATCC 27647 = CGMCC 1.3604 TaxID=1218173 RepID=A0A094XEL4_ALKAL|nr:MarR family transcriptional regulator [Alkalihalobacillus alcalophilus ATCC 27647 = CGMCC 1.3604]
MYTFNKEGYLLEEEVNTLNRLSKLSMNSLNMEAISAVTMIYRAAQGLRNKMEKEVLAPYKLSWTSFSILYDLWIHDSVETKSLAELSGVTKATVSNVTNTLERKDLCYRKSDRHDRRLTNVLITEKGKLVMEELYPHFHQQEVEIVSGLEKEEQKQLSSLLRKVIKDQNF